MSGNSFSANNLSAHLTKWIGSPSEAHLMRTAILSRSVTAVRLGTLYNHFGSGKPTGAAVDC